MAYCRFSSDNWKSEVYVYEDVAGGWTIHVAARRRKGLDTLPPNPLESVLDHHITKEEEAAWMEAYRAHGEALSKLELVDIDLPHAGEVFREASPGEAATRLLELRMIGYHVPQYAIDELQEEQKEFKPA